MGQTLPHGVYLPDEGERNCYDGLAGNWQLLDGAVGTVAEHTIALAGKAPAVHTHTKADVTDLLNSNFIPSANNSYDLGSFSYQWNNLYAKRVNTQSVNGVNPGALSLPDLNTDNVINIDMTNWVYDGTTLNSVVLNTSDSVMTRNGWLYVRMQSTSASDRIGIRIKSTSALNPTTALGDVGFNHIDGFVPVVAGYPVYIFLTKALYLCKFYACQGNV